MEVCRACLSNDIDMKPFDEAFVNGYNLLTNLNIMLFDRLSQYSCQNCVNAVKFYLIFREKSITSESKLQQKLQEAIKSEDDDFIIKENNLEILHPQTVPKLRISKRKFSKHKYDSAIINIKSDPTHVKSSIMLSHLDENLNDMGNEDVKIKVEIEGDKLETVFENSFEEAIDFEDINFFVKNEEIYADVIKPKKLKRERKKKIIMNMSCGLCARTFKKQAELSDHLEEHKKHSRCQLCQEEFAKWPTLLAHRLAHTERRQHRCHICAKYCGCISMMEFHYMMEHNDGQKPEFICKLCLRTYETPRQLKKHTWSSHSQGSVVCDYCSKSFNSKQWLKSHIKTHSEVKKYVCDTCGFTCKRSAGLQDHKIRKHSPRKVHCKMCQRVFPTPEKHAEHSCKGTFKICPVCGVQVLCRLSKHMQMHKGGLYKCDRCPAVYKTKTALKVHLNRHDGIRTNKCEYCPRAFYSASVLTKHRRVHTGEKPYVCKVCQKGFTANHNLKVHMKVHGEHNLVAKRVKEPVNVTSIFM